MGTTGMSQALIRRVDDLFVNGTGQWPYVSSHISHFKFYSTTLAWMAKAQPELLRQMVESGSPRWRKESRSRWGFGMVTSRPNKGILDPIAQAGGRVDFIITDNVFIKSQFRKDKMGDYNWSYEQAVEKYAAYVAGIKTKYPQLKVGITEAAFRFHWEDKTRFPAENPRKDQRRPEEQFSLMSLQGLQGQGNPDRYLPTRVLLRTHRKDGERLGKAKGHGAVLRGRGARVLPSLQ